MERGEPGDGSAGIGAHAGGEGDTAEALGVVDDEEEERSVAKRCRQRARVAWASTSADALPLDVEVVGGEAFQLNYKESEQTVRPRFVQWVERGLVEALDLWRRGE